MTAKLQIELLPKDLVRAILKGEVVIEYENVTIEISTKFTEIITRRQRLLNILSRKSTISRRQVETFKMCLRSKKRNHIDSVRIYERRGTEYIPIFCEFKRCITIRWSEWYPMWANTRGPLIICSV